MRGFFHEIIQSVSQSSFYGRVKDGKVTRSVRYIFLFVFLLSFLFTARTLYIINQGVAQGVVWAKKNLPVVTIENGSARADVAQPFVKEIEESIIIIDTTGIITTLSDYTQGLLLTKHELIYKKSTGETRMYDLRRVKRFRLDEAYMRKAQKLIVIIGFPLIWIMLFLYYGCARFVQILFFSLFAYAIAALQKIELTYSQIFNISVYAATCSMLLGACVGLVGLKIPFFWLAYACVYILYLAKALGNIKRGDSVANPGQGGQ
ncbi:MAG: DUF1189 family protein [Candidatus Omnitrophota bacterium]|nr:DUF1189 domain-containing protein [Candidatus Omnitrophota bacterium]